jgi:hypothetical protein
VVSTAQAGEAYCHTGCLSEIEENPQALSFLSSRLTDFGTMASFGRVCNGKRLVPSRFILPGNCSHTSYTPSIIGGSSCEDLAVLFPLKEGSDADIGASFYQSW